MAMIVRRKVMKATYRREPASALYRYTFAVIVPVGMMFAAYALWLVVPHNPVIFAITAVIVVAWHAGMGPGILAALVTSIAVRPLFLPSAPLLPTTSELLRLALFLVLTFLISALTGARQRAETALLKANAELDDRVHEKTAELRDANEALKLEVAERVRVQEKLERANQLKDEFLAVLGHELRNPLAAISGGTTLLESDPTPDRRAWIEHMMARQVKQLERLVDDLLDVSRITRGKVDLRKQRVSLREILENSAAAVQEAMAQRKHDFTVTLPDDVYLEADSDRLEQVVVNLLSNAAKYTPPGGRVALTAERSADQAVIRCRDNGNGLAPEMLERVFEPFVQSKADNERTVSGLGLGLSLVKSLVEMHGGEVSVSSPGVGQGSEFTVKLPGLKQAPSPALNRTAPQREQASGRSGNILVVDDNRDLAEGLALYLRDAGHNVLLAHDGQTAIELASREQPGTVLLDIGLPDMDGFAVAAKLRDLEGLDGTKIVAISGYNLQGNGARGSLFDARMVKPVNRTAILDWLEQNPVQPKEASPRTRVGPNERRGLRCFKERQSVGQTVP